jgi:hypothetical protein
MGSSLYFLFFLVFLFGFPDGFLMTVAVMAMIQDWGM